MKNSDSDFESWETIAADRSAWHCHVSMGIANLEQTIIEGVEQRRAVGKAKAELPTYEKQSTFPRSL